jgi:hypothetical protein
MTRSVVKAAATGGRALLFFNYRLNPYFKTFRNKVEIRNSTGAKDCLLPNLILLAF